MNSIIDNYHDEHKAFRSYLRTQEGKKGQFLNNLMNAAEIHLSLIIRTKIDISFTHIYDKDISLDTLMYYYVFIESHNEWFTAENGHTAWKSLKYYISYRAEDEDVSWEELYDKAKKAYLEQIDTANSNTQNDGSKIEFTEGNIINSHYDRRERDYAARLKCIEYHGCKCGICGFDFAEAYGEVGRNFIEVHHIVPISSTKGEHSIDPIKDLIPVCSNCHSILHRRRPNPYLPDDIKRMITSNLE